ncbi:hypothetical protein AVEN_93063-1 [Araneus ventricosus]|uniref:Uncharacterized protein n=1 Tax=Araneus ventricosus TaxID=182803 RepID=A0A4Y2PXF2_ARAVE|nr:hypothetical protein AVEN_93063-1 [Araneus ventricosus]
MYYHKALKPDISLEVKKFGPKDLKSALAHAINIESALEQSVDNCTNKSNVDIHNILKENLIKDQLIAYSSPGSDNTTIGLLMTGNTLTGLTSPVSNCIGRMHVYEYGHNIINP